MNLRTLVLKATALPTNWATTTVFCVEPSLIDPSTVISIECQFKNHLRCYASHENQNGKHIQQIKLFYSDFKNKRTEIFELFEEFFLNIGQIDGPIIVNLFRFKQYCLRMWFDLIEIWTWTFGSKAYTLTTRPPPRLYILGHLMILYYNKIVSNEFILTIWKWCQIWRV